MQNRNGCQSLAQAILIYDAHHEQSRSNERISVGVPLSSSSSLAIIKNTPVATSPNRRSRFSTLYHETLYQFLQLHQAQCSTPDSLNLPSSSKTV
ncbi:hypothetical protein AN958_12268 [Leucoagaricus sp. SymC.cos]|nr:hypothetical protein AN958_12268 [Leucoagaricus sp. SymC.cos]